MAEHIEEVQRELSDDIINLVPYLLEELASTKHEYETLIDSHAMAIKENSRLKHEIALSRQSGNALAVQLVKQAYTINEFQKKDAKKSAYTSKGICFGYTDLIGNPSRYIQKGQVVISKLEEWSKTAAEIIAKDRENKVKSEEQDNQSTESPIKRPKNGTKSKEISTSKSTIGRNITSKLTNKKKIRNHHKRLRE